MIGYEFEFLVREGEKPLSRETFFRVHQELQGRGWKPHYDHSTNVLIGSEKDGFFVTIDDAFCILELNTPPYQTIQECERHVGKLLDDLQAIYRRFDASIIGTSAFPGPTDVENTGCTTKCLNKDCCGKAVITYINVVRCNPYHHALYYIAANHVWLDVTPATAMAAMDAFNRLSGVIVGLFGSGPVANEKPLGVIEGRETMWRAMLDHSAVDYDKKIYGMLPQPLLSFFDYFDFVMATPFYYSFRDGKAFSLVDKAVTYRNFFDATEADAIFFDGKRFSATPTVADFLRLQNITFPNARLKYTINKDAPLSTILAALRARDLPQFLSCFEKFFVECRSVGAQKRELMSAGPAFLTGILHNLSAVTEALDEKPYAFWLDLYHRSTREGLIEPQLLERFARLSEAGLRQRGFHEETFLQPLFARIAARKNPGQALLETFRRGGLSALFTACDFPVR